MFFYAFFSSVLTRLSRVYITSTFRRMTTPTIAYGRTICIRRLLSSTYYIHKNWLVRIFCCYRTIVDTFHFIWFQVQCSNRCNSGGVLKTHSRRVCAPFLECFSVVITPRVSFVTWIHPYGCRSYMDHTMLFQLCLLFFPHCRRQYTGLNMLFYLYFNFSEYQVSRSEAFL